MYNVNFTEQLISGVKHANLSWPKTTCLHGWTFNYTTVPYASIAAEVDIISLSIEEFLHKLQKKKLIFQLEWICDQEFYSSAAQSIFYIGSIVGGFIFGYVADHYGRLPALVACNAVGFFASIGTAFCYNFWTFCLCRFIAGTAFDNCFNIIFIISNKWGKFFFLCILEINIGRKVFRHK